jgi:23S rRNA (guanosine2251-2'-O)-methyltransferase
MSDSSFSASYIYGKQPVAEALRGSQPIDKIWIQRGLRSDQLSEIADQARRKNVMVQFVPPEKLASMSKTAHHQGVVASVAHIEYHDYVEVIEELLAAEITPFVVLLDGVTDVRNMGAIARTAYGMGVDVMIIPAKGAAPINSEAIKSSAGVLQHLTICKTPHVIDAVRYLQQCGVTCVALDARGSQMASEAGLSLPLAVVLGDEHRGVDQRVLREVGQVVRLPISENLDSYNVSVAAAMLLYEVKRVPS